MKFKVEYHGPCDAADTVSPCPTTANIDKYDSDLDCGAYEVDVSTCAFCTFNGSSGTSQYNGGEQVFRVSPTFTDTVGVQNV